MRVVFAHIHKYKVLEDVVVNIDSNFNYSMLSPATILKNAKKIPQHFFGENLSMHCVIGKNGSGKSILMNLLLGGEECLNEGEWYHLLYEDKGEYLLHSVDMQGERIFSCEEKDVGIISIKEEITTNDDKPKHLAFYLSSNNINMLKSWRSDKTNDLSIGNELRFRRLHNTHEAYHYNMLKRGNTTLTKSLLNRNIHFKVSFNWLMSYDDTFGPKQRIMPGDIRRMAEEGDSKSILCHFLLRTFEKMLTINEMLRIDAAHITNLKNREFQFVLFTYCLHFFGQREDITLTSRQEKRMDEFLSQFQTRVRYTDNYFELISEDSNDFLFDVFTRLLSGYEIISHQCRFYIEPPFSTGQWKRVELASKLNLLVRNYHNQVLNILLDEPDADLHPELQTELVSWIIGELADSDNQFNIILSTHNPLILSDFPAESITSLDKVSTTDINKTFAANIYDLYKNTFMIDHAMGKFASDKVRDALLSNSHDIKLLTFLQQEIAEPLIVREISNVMLTLDKNNRVDDILKSLTEDEIVMLRARISNNEK